MDCQVLLISGRPNVGAGIGHAFAEWHTAFYLAKELGFVFVHQPFRDEWDEFLGFGNGEIKISQIASSPIYLPMLDLDNGLDEFKRLVGDAKDGTFFHLAPGQNIKDHTLDENRIKEKYWNGKRKIYFSKPFIAVHTRRNTGDAERELSPEYLATVLSSIKNIVDYDVHVFSDGVVEGLGKFHAVHHVDGNVFDDFHMMASADILVLGRSGFSYLAGIVSSGIKIGSYPWWHVIPDEGKWFRSDLSGNFNIERFKECLG